MKKKIIIISLVAFLIFTKKNMIINNVYAKEYLDNYNHPNVYNPEEIGRFLEKHQFSFEKIDTYRIKPNINLEQGSVLDDRSLRNAENSLNFFRFIAGLDSIKINQEFAQLAGIGATYLSGTNQFDHFPEKVDNISQSFYDKACSVTSSSNISWGIRSSAVTVSGYMHDSDANNYEHVGHRRWCLDPELREVGFGMANNTGAMYFDMMGECSQGNNYADYVLWPARYTPQQFFGGMWSIQLNPLKFKISQNIVVDLFLSSGKKISLSVNDDNCYVDEQGFGGMTAIIFNPNNENWSEIYNGTDVKVVVRGIIDRKENKEIDFSYKVNFFDINNYTDLNSLPYTIGCWEKTNGKWWFRYFDNTYPNNQVKKISGKLYYFDKYGYLASGKRWTQIGNNWYYFVNEQILTKWNNIRNEWFYFNDFGDMHIGWKEINGEWYYFDSNGHMYIGWKEINGEWYYFDSNGHMYIGWNWINDKCYYFDMNGRMAANTTVDDSYVDKSGAWVIDKWIKNENGWWYRHANGSYTNIGWEKIGDSWFYFADNGYMQTGWKEINGEWYYFDSNGHMRIGWKEINGEWYYFDSNGHMYIGWNWINDKCYYFDMNGRMAANTIVDDSYVDKSGAWVIDKWIKNENGWWYRHANGSYTNIGWEKIGDSWFYFADNGYMQTGWKEINGEWYYFDSNGHMVKTNDKY